MTEEILVGTQIKQLFEDNDYSTKLNATDWRIWQESGIVSRNVLKPKRGYLKSKFAGANVIIFCQWNLMSCFPITFFLEYMGAFSDGHCEGFHLDFYQMKKL